jgi:hypothetical protein
LREGVEFAYMKFLGEGEGVDSGAIEILGKSLQLAARVGERLLAVFANAQASAIDLDVETSEARCDAADCFVGFIEALQRLRMGELVEARGCKENVELEQGEFVIVAPGSDRFWV